MGWPERARALGIGFIPEAVVVTLCPDIPDPYAAARRLVDVGLWEKVPGGYRISDWCGCEIVMDHDTQEQRKVRPYQQWRRAVLERDAGHCALCGVQEPHLHVHHIRPWAYDPGGRFSVDNGITLCAQCHRREHREQNGG